MPEPLLFAITGNLLGKEKQPSAFQGEQRMPILCDKKEVEALKFQMLQLFSAGSSTKLGHQTSMGYPKVDYAPSCRIVKFHFNSNV